MGRRYFEQQMGAARAADALGVQIDRERGGAVGGAHTRFERITVGGLELDRQEAVLQRILPVDVGEAAGDDAADAGRDHRPHRARARGAAAEIAAGHQDAGRAELRLVEREVRIVAPIGELAGMREQQRRVIGIHVAIDGRDLIRIDVVLQERDGNTGERGEGLHQAAPETSCRTSTMRPAMAVAAAGAGPARWVRTPLTWRPSKLRVVVETQRSPGSPRSPVPPAHMEQPASPPTQPAARNPQSRPAASAWRFTVDEPGTTMATTPAATCRPRTIAPAASRSGSRLLLQEPIKTRFTGRPASRLPGVSHL